LEIQNTKQKYFFDEAVRFEAWEKKKAENAQDFDHLLVESNYCRLIALGEFHREIDDNLLLLQKSKARIAYLKRIQSAIDLRMKAIASSVDSLDKGIEKNTPISILTSTNDIFHLRLIKEKLFTFSKLVFLTF
jgi:hypothetical protein